MKRAFVFAVLLFCLCYGVPQVHAVTLPPTHDPIQSGPALGVSPQFATYTVSFLHPQSNTRCVNVQLTGTYTAVAVIASAHLWVTPLYPRRYAICLHDIPHGTAIYNESATFSSGLHSTVFAAQVLVSP